MSRSRNRLKAALSQIDHPCPYSDQCLAYIKWDAEERVHKIKVVHPDQHCPGWTRPVFQARASSYLISLLELYGVRCAEYLEPELEVLHDVR